jgi:hypothetical protein
LGQRSTLNQIEALFDPIQSRFHGADAVGDAGDLGLNLRHLDFKRTDALRQLQKAANRPVEFFVEPVKARQHSIHRFIDHDDAQLPSSRQRTPDGLRLALDDPQESPGRALGTAATLFPVLHGIELEAESQGKLGLGESETLADGRDVNLIGHVRHKLLTRTARIRQRLACAAKNALTGL